MPRSRKRYIISDPKGIFFLGSYYPAMYAGRDKQTGERTWSNTFYELFETRKAAKTVLDVLIHEGKTECEIITINLNDEDIG